MLKYLFRSSIAIAQGNIGNREYEKFRLSLMVAEKDPDDSSRNTLENVYDGVPALKFVGARHLKALRERAVQESTSVRYVDILESDSQTFRGIVASEPGNILFWCI